MRKENKPDAQAKNRLVKYIALFCSFCGVLALLVAFEIHLRQQKAMQPVALQKTMPIKERSPFSAALQGKQQEQQARIRTLEQQLAEARLEMTQLKGRLYKTARLKFSQTESLLDQKQKEAEDLYGKLHLISLQFGETEQKNSWLNETLKELNSLVQLQQIQLDHSHDHFEQLMRTKERQHEGERLDLHSSIEQLGLSKQKLRDTLANQQLLMSTLKERLHRQSEHLIQQQQIIKAQEEVPFNHFKEMQAQIHTLMMAIETNQLQLAYLTLELEKSGQTITQHSDYATALNEYLHQLTLQHQVEIAELENQKIALSEECLELNCLIDVLAQIEEEEEKEDGD